jgi:uncharacterized coiled-coil DUF342 family protein
MVSAKEWHNRLFKIEEQIKKIRDEIEWLRAEIIQSAEENENVRNYLLQWYFRLEGANYHLYRALEKVEETKFDMEEFVE